jgi:hypothetical protein
MKRVTETAKNELSLKKAMFLGFCAVFIVFTKVALRLHLNISGHSMFFTAFFLLLARGCVNWRFSATVTGLFSGVMAIILGLGKGGPFMLIKFVLPAAVVDISCLFFPLMFENFLLCAIVAALAGMTKFFSTYLVDYLIGMDKDLIIQHALVKSAFNIFFSICGGLLIPPVIKRLKAFGAI